MRIGIVGCGHIGTVHAYALKQLSDAGLVDAHVAAAYDADDARAAKLVKNLGGDAAASLDALVDGVDVVWVCTWTAAHLEAVEAAVARGLPVFCEKPLAPDLAACEQVSATLERVPHQVGLVLRFAPVFAKAAELVNSGRYGRPLTTILRDDQYFPIQGMYGSTWRKDVEAAGGGTLIEHSIHDVDVLRWILGDPLDVSATTACAFGYEGIEDFLAENAARYDMFRADFDELRPLPHGRLLAVGHICLRGKGSTDEIRYPTAGIAMFRDGRLSSWRDYGNEAAALAAAGES